MSGVSEDSEQAEVVRRLRRARYLVAAVPNGGHRDAKTAGILKRTGVVQGVPDLLIFESPDDPSSFAEGLNGYERDVLSMLLRLEAPRRRRVIAAAGFIPGVGLEMKRLTGGVVSRQQVKWLGMLESRGWLPMVGRGWRDAVKQLKAVGFNRL